MGVKVAGEAVGEFTQHRVAVGFSMTICTVGNQPMLGMAGYARDLTMLAGGLAPAAINRVVTTTAGFQIDIALEGNLQRLMHRMTGCTSRHRLLFVVRLMTVGTGRNIPVTGVTGRAGLQGVLARVLLELSRR